MGHGNQSMVVVGARTAMGPTGAMRTRRRRRRKKKKPKKKPKREEKRRMTAVKSGCLNLYY
jgi:hypothetical protein